MRRALALLALLAVAAAPADWRALVSPRDRNRLRDWRVAWTEGLAQARAAGFARAVAEEGVLLDPDGATNDPAAPDGDYRCRMIKLGHQAGPGLAFRVLTPVPCRLREGRFETLAGAQRPSGRLWVFDGPRMLFLGATALADERPFGYGRDRDRDALGLFERIGPARWRLVLPRPAWESTVDVIELVPAWTKSTPAQSGALADLTFPFQRSGLRRSTG